MIFKDTGPLTRKRMETIDNQSSDAAIKFMQKRRTAASRSSSGGRETRPESGKGCTEDNPKAQRQRSMRSGIVPFLVVIAGLGMMPTVLADDATPHTSATSKPADPDRWRFTVAPYLWGPVSTATSGSAVSNRTST